MVLHELATNAAKYGALSTKTGRVSIRWHRHLNGHARSHLVFEWQEMGGPPVGALGKSSFGTSTIRHLIPYEFGGTVDLVLAPEGVRCRLELPADWLTADRPPLAPPHMRPEGPEFETVGRSKDEGERACIAGEPSRLDLAHRPGPVSCDPDERIHSVPTARDSKAPISPRLGGPVRNSWRSH